MSTKGIDSVENLEEQTVLVVGGGPVGLMVATVLAHYGVRSIILERNNSTTKWPKMDLTNGRSMELLARLGLADDVRRLGVSDSTPYNVYMTTGLHNAKEITSWEYPCVNELRAEIRRKNDGTAASEPWQRISQTVFEKYLKDRCDENPLIDCRFGWKVEHCLETEDHVLVTATHVPSDKKIKLRTNYLVGCDGASSITRRELQIPLEGGPVPGYTLLVHFKSRDLGTLFKFGPFWHLFIFTDAGLHAAAICQDDKDTFTTHLLLPLNVDHASIDSHDAIYTALGGLRGPIEVKIDEILVRSAYRHSIAVSRNYCSAKGRVYLAGDSAHQNIPTGGYGMNTGIGDAFDIGWKLAAVINNNAGPKLLASYEEERRPIALNSVERSGVHMQVHVVMAEILEGNSTAVEENSPEAQALRTKIHQHYQEHNGENKDLGVEMDHRHKSNVYPAPTEADGEEPPWDPAMYIPSTFPGSRAPHVFLKDGSSIFNHYGPYWTLLEFVDEPSAELRGQTLLDGAAQINMPLKHVVLSDEKVAHALWGFPLVLVRPDGHVVLRRHEAVDAETALQLLKVAAGWADSFSQYMNGPISKPFTATASAENQVQEYKLERMGAMQI